MPTTRKKVIKTVYKDDESDDQAGDFSDSGSEAHISEPPSSDEEDIEGHVSSADETSTKTTKNRQKQPIIRKPKFAKKIINKINKQTLTETEENDDMPQFSVKDLTDADKLLPSVMNLSESDSSDDETPKASIKKATVVPNINNLQENVSDNEQNAEYCDVWGSIPDNSEEIAKKTFMELEKHKNTVEETKASLQNYVSRSNIEQTQESNVTDLLALGEVVALQEKPVKIKKKHRRAKGDSDSDVEDWEEVKESKAIPQQGLQLVVALPDTICRKSKKIDVEMMMKRKINRVKKEHQVFMHKVHVLCWIGHGNYVSPVLNDQEIMTAVLQMVPKGCYPENRLDMKYVEQITKWYKEKIIIKQDKHENKFKPKAPPLRSILLDQIKCRVVTAKKYMVFIFVAMLRALGLQCRIMFNFVTVPLKPPVSELCSLSTKPKDDKNDNKVKKVDKVKCKSSDSKPKSKVKLPQVDGNHDSFSSSEDEFEITCDDDNYCFKNNKCKKWLHENNGVVTYEAQTFLNKSATNNYERGYLSVMGAFDNCSCYFKNIMQVDGNDDTTTTNPRPMRATRVKKVEATKKSNDAENEGVSPSKRSKKDVQIPASQDNEGNEAELKKCNEQSKIKNISKYKEKRDGTKSNLKDNDVVSNISKSPKALSLKKPIKHTVVIRDGKSRDIERTKLPEVKASSRKTRYNSKTSKMTYVKTDTTTISDSQVEINTAQKRTKEKSSLPKAEENISEINQSKYFEPIKKDNKIVAIKSHAKITDKSTSEIQTRKKIVPPKVLVTDENNADITESMYFEPVKTDNKRSTRKRSHTTKVDSNSENSDHNSKDTKPKLRTKSAPGDVSEKSRYFDESKNNTKRPKLSVQQLKKLEKIEDAQRVSHKDLLKSKSKPKNDVTGDLTNIIKGRIKVVKEEAKRGVVKGKSREDSDDDSDYLPIEDPKGRVSSDEEFKPTKISPRGPKLCPGVKPSTSKKRIDRRVISSDEETQKSNNDNKVDVWCEVFVEELEQWIAVDVASGKVHCAGDLYKHATHPVCYVIGWDNNNYLKDLTRRYVPHWNTVTRKQRVEPTWWRDAVQPWLGPRNARDKEEDEALDRMQLEAPLPTTIGEYKNHPLYALKRHLLKYEALYPPDAQVLGFVRNEPVYARECVHVCRSRDTWLKEAKVVKMGEKPYKIVKARPKWDKLSNKVITDKPLEVFGPWQVQDYEPPTAQNGIVPRNPYGNVELFKECMLPKGTVHIKLPGLNKVCRKLNIDCAPAMTGFDFNGGYTHPVYDGFVVCTEYGEIVTEAWLKDQEEQERKEREKLELRVYGNWKRLIKGLLIRERLKYKYGFEEPSTSQVAKKKGPRFVTKKN